MKLKDLKSTVLNRFCRHADENKRQKVALILDKLITMTIDEVEVSCLC